MEYTITITIIDQHTGDEIEHIKIQTENFETTREIALLIIKTRLHDQTQITITQ